MSGDQIFTLGEHLLLLIALGLLVIIGPGRLKQIKDMLEDVRLLVQELAKLSIGLNGAADTLKTMLPPAGHDKPGQPPSAPPPSHS